MTWAPNMLFIAERFPPDLGGLARSAERMSAALARIGGRVDVLAWTKALPPGQLETKESDGERSAPPTAAVHQLGLFANWDLSMQHTLNVLEWLHERARYDIVWGHYLYPAGFAAVWFARWAGLNSIVSARGNDVDRMMFPPGDFARLTWTLENADLVTAVSTDLARKIGLLLNGDDRVEIVRNVVDADVFTPGPPDAELRATLGIQPDEVVLGFSGELRHKKGYTFLLAALAEVCRARPACLLVIGEMRARERAHLSLFASEHPEAAARVIVTGHLDDPQRVADHLRLCDLYVQPSVWEGLPNALLEALACECVCLTSDAGGIPDVIQHEANGFIVPTALLNHFGTAALDILSLPAEQRAALGAAGRQHMIDAFHPDAEAATLRRLLDGLRPNSSS